MHTHRPERKSKLEVLQPGKFEFNWVSTTSTILNPLSWRPTSSNRSFDTEIVFQFVMEELRSGSRLQLSGIICIRYLRKLGAAK